MTYTLQSTQTFNHWLAGLKDPVVRNKVLTRLDRVVQGNFGDCKTLANGCVSRSAWGCASTTR